MNLEKELEKHAKSEIEKELRKYKCKVHHKSPVVKSMRNGSAVIDCCCDEFQAIVEPHFS